MHPNNSKSHDENVMKLFSSYTLYKLQRANKLYRIKLIIIIFINNIIITN